MLPAVEAGLYVTFTLPRRPVTGKDSVTVAASKPTSNMNGVFANAER